MSATEQRRLHGEILLDGRDIDVAIGGGLVSLSEEHAIDGSPTVRVSVFDPDRVLVSSGLLDVRASDEDRLRSEVELRVDNVNYWLRHVAKREDMFELTFEQETVARMRVRRGAMRVRARVEDHRRFIARLCARSGVPAPVTAAPGPRELAARQRAGIGTRLRLDRRQAERDERRAPGLADGANITIKGRRADAEQIRNLNVGLSEALLCDPTPLALVTLVAAGIVESDWRNKQGAGADHVSWGVIQNIPGRSAGVNGTVTREQALDVAYSVRSALLPPGPTSAGGLIKVSRQQPDLDPGTLADICINGLGVGDPRYPEKVNGRRDEAARIIRAFTGSEGLASGLSSVTFERVIESPLTVERGETDWDAAMRTAESYGFRFFVAGNQPYYLADEILMRSRPRLGPLSEDSPGVDWIDWEWAPHKQLRRTELRCRATAWHAPVGSVVLLDRSCGPAGESDDNPAQGRWLVGEYRRDRFSSSADVTLIKGRRPTVPTETQTETIEVAGNVRGVPDGMDLAGVPGVVQAALAAAYRIDGKGYPYAWGGGHPQVGKPSQDTRTTTPRIGYDCSGYVGAVLSAAGLAYTSGSVPASGSMTSLGLSGQGRWMTVWANATHVYIEFRLPGGTFRADTGGGPPDGPRVRRGARSNSGFTPRHFRGT